LSFPAPFTTSWQEETTNRCFSDIRSLFAFAASRHAGFSNKSLAEFLKNDISNISNMLRKIEEKITKDRKYSDYLNKIIKVIKA